MRSISRRKSIVTALAAGSLAVLATAGVAHAAVNPAPPSSVSGSTALVADVPSVGDIPDARGPGDVRTAGDSSDKAKADVPGAGDTRDGPSDKADGPADKAGSRPDKADSPADTDNVQQGDQSGPDTTSGSTAKE